MEENLIRSILEQCKTVAIVGLSKDSQKDSYRVAEYLKSQGYRVVPVNPFADEILGEKCFKSLLDMPEDVQKTIEVVDIFRPPEDVPPIVEQAIELKKRFNTLEAVWMQLGITNEASAAKARKAGLKVIMNACMMMQHKNLKARAKETKDEELETIRSRKMQEMMTKVMKETKKDAPVVVEDSTFEEFVKQYPLVVVDFWAAWCDPCRMIAPVVEELAKEYGGRVVFGKLNVDENPDTPAQFGVVGIPTLVVLKGGVEVDRIVGAVPKDAIKAKLARHL
ncbi:MAG: thioredoxin [Candidatus Bathyarchaeia archaeon]|jgi:thioredoxin|nr:thioredoxin [Candidatus Bathyarchaeota archaeon]